MITGLLGVVHLLPMPGDPLCPLTSDFEDVRAHALRDAEALVNGGVQGVVIENFGSTPFVKGGPSDRTPPHQVAFMASLVRECMQRFGGDGAFQIGVNCLRNDIVSALGIAAACGLGESAYPGFVRVNVHSGAYVTDQGLIEGEAAHSVRYRHALRANGVQILADVHVKHASPLVPIDPKDATHDCLQRGLADAVVVTGKATGAPVAVDLLRAVSQAAGQKPVIIGSGLAPMHVDELAPLAHGAIVGTWFKRDGHVQNPVDAGRVRELAALVKGKFKAREV